MQRSLSLIGSIVALCLHGALAQLPAYYEPSRFYREALELFDKGKYSAATEKFQTFLDAKGYDRLDLSNELNANARFYQAASAWHLNLPDAEAQLSGFIANYPDNSKWAEAHYYLGKFYFNATRYRDATRPLAVAFDRGALSGANARELEYMLGYCYLSSEAYAKAQPLFDRVANSQSPYAQDARYYRGIMSYKNKDYNAAYNDFKALETSEKYKNETRAYLATCMLKMRRFSELTDFADRLMKDPQLRKQSGPVFQTAANAAFERNEFEKSALYFNEFSSTGGKPSRSDFFRYGQSLYKQGKFKEAIPNYEKAAIAPGNKSDSLAQVASYYLGFSYLEQKDLNSARVAFEKAATAPEPAYTAVSEDALYQYAKVAFETKYYDVAQKALRDYVRRYPNGIHISEVRSLTGEMLFYSKNYQEAVAYFESIPLTDARSRRAYQTACFYYGTLLFDKGRFKEAQTYFQKAISNSSDPAIGLSAQYWLAHARFRDDDFDGAIQSYTAYQNASGARTHEYYNMATYGLAWSNFKQKKYSSALKGFEEFLRAAGAEVQPRYRVDAMLRAGDCNFMRRDYAQADKLYRQAADQKLGYQDYAAYQMAESRYRQGDYRGSVDGFLRLTTSFRNSELRDNALDRASEIFATWLKDYTRASEIAEQLVKEYPRSPLAAAGYNRMALAAYFRGDEAGAIQHFKKVLSDYSGEAASCQIALENLSQLLPAAEYDRIFNEYKRRNPQVNQNLASLVFNNGVDRFYSGSYDAAIEQFSTYINDYPSGANFFEALLYRARSYKAKSQFDRAFSDLERVYNATPSNAFSSVALLEAAELRFEQNDTRAARGLFEELERNAGKAENKAEARFGIAKCQAAEGSFADAIRTLGTIANDNQLENLTRERARFEIGLNQFNLKQYETALRSFQEVERDNKTEYGARSQYMIVKTFFEMRRYEDARSAYLYLQNNYAFYNYWKAKALLVIADVELANRSFFQARGILESLINGSAEFPDIVQEARELLSKVESAERGG